MSTIVEPTNPVTRNPLPNGGFEIRGIADQENQLEGSENSDIIIGGNSNDILSGGAGGSDTIIGGAGDDSISAGDGNDSLSGEDGNDLISGGAGENVITGGDGDDRLIVNGGGSTLTGGAGNDVFQLNLAQDTPEETTQQQIQTSNLNRLNLAITEITDFTPGEDTLSIQGTADEISAAVYNRDTGILSLDDVAVASLGSDLNINEDDIEIAGNNNPLSVVNNDEATVYRFYDATAGAHFYTADEVERDNIQQNLPNYNLEGESYQTVDPTTGEAQQVYRFFNPDTGVHLYTTDEVERDSIIETLPNFQFEGVKFYAYETEVEGSIPVFRFYEPSLGVHFYTPNEAERDSVQANLSNYSYEGIAYYALPVDEDIV